VGKRFASFYRCLAFARFWKVNFWRSFIKCKHFNDDRLDGFSQIYISLYLYLGFFSKTGKTRVSHRVKMMTRWPGRESWPKWPIDPVTRWPSSMSGVHTTRYIFSQCDSTLCLIKTTTDIFSCNSSMRRGILIVFGKNVSQKVEAIERW